MTRPAGALDSLVAEKIEVALSGMVDPLVHHSPGQSVAVAILVVVRWEEPAGIEREIERHFTSKRVNLPGVVTLLHDDVGDHWLVILLQLLASLSDGHQLLRQHRQELPLAHTIAVHDDLLGLPALVRSVELDEEVLGDLLHVVDDLLVLPSLLDSDLNLVVGGLRLHRAHNGRNAWL